MFSFFAHLVCTKCGRVHERDSRFGVCPAPECGGPLFARYHDRPLDRDAFEDRPRTMWRWREMMP
ncbi:MAG TPA: threonine synthase, partial [Thermoanaerobaculia bacterium]